MLTQDKTILKLLHFQELWRTYFDIEGSTNDQPEGLREDGNQDADHPRRAQAVELPRLRGQVPRRDDEHGGAEKLETIFS